MYQEQQMMVVVEGRRPLCWDCKQLRHLVITCPQKTASINNNKTTGTTTSTALEPGVHPDNQEKDVSWLLEKSHSPATTSESAEATIAATTETTTADTVPETTAITTETTRKKKIITNQPPSPPKNEK